MPPRTMSERSTQQGAGGERRLGSRFQPKPKPKWLMPTVLGIVGALAIGGIVWGLLSHNKKVRAEEHKLARFKAGCQAVTAFAESVKPLVQEFQTFKKDHPKDPWLPKKVEAKALPEEPGVEDAVLLVGNTKVASLTDKAKTWKGPAEVSPDQHVEVRSGTYLSVSGENVACLRFTVTLPSGGLEKALAVVLLRPQASE